MGETTAIPSRPPREPLRTVRVPAVGPHTGKPTTEHVAVWASRNGLAITTSLAPIRGYSITHLATGYRVFTLFGLSWREAVTALSLTADLGPWAEVRGRIGGPDWADLVDCLWDIADMATAKPSRVRP